MHSILYFPDGNRRYATKHHLPLREVYIKAIEKTLRLCSSFFLVEKKCDTLTYIIYTYIRKDSSYKVACQAIEQILHNLIKNRFFEKNQIMVEIISHTQDLPKNILFLAKKLADSTKNFTERRVKLVLGYSLEKDFNDALQENPRTYKALCKKLLFSNIDLVLRTMEMKISKGPIYAMDNAQMIQINKLNPEVTKRDLQKVWDEYRSIVAYRNSLK